MEKRRIVRKVKIPADEVGRSVAIQFDYGPVQSEMHGEAILKGTILRFTPYEDEQKILSERLPPTLVELVLSFGKDAKSVGACPLQVKRDIKRRIPGGFQTDKMQDVYTVLYDGVPSLETKLFVVILIFFDLIEEVIDITEADGLDLRPVIELVKCCLDGRWTHLNQFNPPKHLELSLAAALLIRREALVTKSKDGWPFLKHDILRYLWGSYNEGKRQYRNLEDYKHFREATGGGSICLESDWMCRGIKISENVRSDPDFQYFKHQAGLYAGLLNDVIGLNKELKKGEQYNMVVILAQSMSLQQAIEESVKELESVFFKIRTAASNLVVTFSNDENVKELIRTAGRCVDFILDFEGALYNRYGIQAGSSHFVVMEFSESIVIDEKELEKVMQDEIALKNLAKLRKPVENPVDSRQERKQFQQNKQIVPSLIHNEINQNCQASPSNGTRTVMPEDKIALKHLAITPDGSRRWARERGYSPWKGHDLSKDIIATLTKAAWRRGVHTVTFWALSSENFERSKEELNLLWICIGNFLHNFREIAKDFDARVFHIGNKNRLPIRLKRVIDIIEKETRDNSSRRLNLAIDYSGRQDIFRAVSKMEKPMALKDISGKLWGGDQLYPEPDLIVRTGCKDSETVRLSGFMIWESVHSELLFENKYMPEVTEEDLHRWIDGFNGAERRMGK